MPLSLWQAASVSDDDFALSYLSITSLFERQFEIPAIQRPFAWTDHQAIDVVADILSLVNKQHLKQSASHFFGTIVTLPAQDSEYEPIIDGQQRLTTITALGGLLAAALDELANEAEAAATTLPENERQHLLSISTAVAKKSENLRILLTVPPPNATLATPFHDRLPRLRVSSEIHKTYLAILQGRDFEIPDEGRQPAHTLRAIAQRFEDHLVRPSAKKMADGTTTPYGDLSLEDRAAHLVELERAFYALKFVKLRPRDASMGYELFESLNAKGIPLNELDLLKLWILSKLHDAQVPAARRNKISERFKKLTDDDIDKQKTFFEDYCKSQTSMKIEIHAKDRPNVRAKRYEDEVFSVDRKGEELAHEQLVDGIEQRTVHLETLFPAWVRLTTKGLRVPTQFENALEKNHLRLSLSVLHDQLGSQQATPALLLASDVYRDDAAGFQKLVQTFELFYFRAKSLGSANENDIKGVLAQWLDVLRFGQRLSDSELLEPLRAVVNAKSDSQLFQRNVEGLSYSKPSDRTKIKYFLIRLAAEESNNPPALLFDSSQYSKFHLEHVVPQAAPGALNDEELHSIGNLCLLDPKINTKLQALSFAQKKQRLQELHQQNVINWIPDSARLFAHPADQWTNAEVSARSQTLSKRALQMFTI